jgi:NADH:ubiquinone oxidoreductase subunit F (NADH-binding)
MAIEEILGRIVKGQGVAGDIEKVLAACDTIMGLTLCPTGDAFSMPIQAMVTKFRSEFEARIR